MIIFIMGLALGLLTGLEVGGWGRSSLLSGNSLPGELMGGEMKGFLFGIYLFTLLVHFVMFTFMFVHS